MALIYTFRCIAYSKTKESIVELSHLANDNCIEYNEDILDSVGNIWKLDICGNVKYSCWNIVDHQKEELQDVCKRLGIALEIFGEVSEFVEYGEEIPEEWKDEYKEDQDGIGTRIYFHTQHIFIWENGEIDSSEDEHGKLDGYWEWETDEEMIAHFNGEEE